MQKQIMCLLMGNYPFSALLYFNWLFPTTLFLTHLGKSSANTLNRTVSVDVTTFVVLLWLSGEQGCPSVRRLVVRSPAPLAHVDVSLGKILNPKWLQ